MRSIHTTALSLAALTLLFAGEARSQNISSIYTQLSENKCKTIELDESGAGHYRGRCAGVGGFKLDVVEGDIRQTIDVIFPSGSRSELNLWSVVSGAFSSVGPKAEWRVKTVNKKVVPHALIVRFETSHEDQDSETFKQIKTSYLVVAKIENGSACVTDIIMPSVPDQNVQARKAADVAAGKPCRTAGQQ